MTAPEQHPSGPPAGGHYGPSGPGYGAPGYAAPGYGAPGYTAPGYTAPGYAAPGYGGPGYPAPGYGMPGQGYGVPPWPGPPVRRPWPYGDGRPGVATAAGVLGIVTGGLTALVSLGCLLGTVGGDPSSAVLLLFTAPCAIGTLTGGIRLLQGHRRGLLLGSAVASIGVLLLGLLVGALVYAGDQVLGVVVLVVLALPLPLVTAVLAAHPTVQGWTEGTPPR